MLGNTLRAAFNATGRATWKPAWPTGTPLTRTADELFGSSCSGGTTVIQTVTAIIGIVVGLTLLFGFVNVLNLALRLGAPVWAAPGAKISRASWAVDPVVDRWQAE
jgi:hypothetical protein